MIPRVVAVVDEEGDEDAEQEDGEGVTITDSPLLR